MKTEEEKEPIDSAALVGFQQESQRHQREKEILKVVFCEIFFCRKIIKIRLIQHEICSISVW